MMNVCVAIAEEDAIGRFDEVYDRSLSDPEGFWTEAAEAIHWEKKWDKLLDKSNPPFYRWFLGAECNTCYNAVDRHVEEGRADQAAVIYDSPITGRKKTFTYRQLRLYRPATAKTAVATNAKLRAKEALLENGGNGRTCAT